MINFWGSPEGRRRVAAVNAALAALTACTAVAVAAISAGGEIKVNTTSGNHDFAAVAMQPNGNFIVAFESPENVAIAARRFNSAGTPLGGEIPISVSGDPNQEDPSVAIDQTGDAVVAWEDGAGATPDDVKARRVNAAGAVVGAPIAVNTTATGDQDEPQVGMDAAGNFVVAWEGEGPGDANGIFMRRYSSAGAPLSGEVRVSQTTLDAQQSAAIAMNATGEFVIAWNGPDGMGDRDIFARRYAASGAPVGGEFHVNQNVSDFGEEPGAGIDAAGNFVVAWAGEKAADADGGVVFRLFASGGAPASGDILANTTTAGYQGTSDRTGVAMDPAGNVVVAWEDSSGTEPDDVKLRRFGPTGAPLTGELRANTTLAGDQDDVRVSAAANGNFVAAWVGENALGDRDVVARLYTVPPPPDLTPPVVSLTGKRKQKAGKPVAVEAGCDEACMDDAGGKVQVKGGGGKASSSGEALKLKEQTVQLAAGQTVELRLKLKRKEAKRLKKDAADGAKATAKVLVTATDDAGNSSEARKKVKLK